MVDFLLSLVGESALSTKEYLGRTPLHYSALVSEGDRGVYELLVDKGSDTDIKDSEGHTPEDYLQDNSSQIGEGKLMEVPEAPRYLGICFKIQYT